MKAPLTKCEEKLRRLKERLSTSRTREIILLNQVLALKEELAKLKSEGKCSTSR